MSNDLVLGLKELDRAYPHYERAARYFEGEPREVLELFHPRIRAMLARMGQAYRFRLARKPVTVLANRLKLTSVTVPDDDGATRLLDDIRSANQMGIWEQEVILRTLEYGDAYAMVWPVDEDEPTLPEKLRQVGVEITVHTPLNVRVVYDQQTRRRALFVVNRWLERNEVLGTEQQRVDLYYRDRVERYYRAGAPTWAPIAGALGVSLGYLWGAGESMAQSDAGGWLPFVDDQSDDTGVLDNPYGELPFFHYRNAVPYGRPEHADAYGPQDAINKLLTTHLASVDAMGFPQRVALMDPAAVLDENNDDPDWDDDTEAAVQSGATPKKSGVGSSQRSGPGILQYLTGIKDVKEFSPAESANFTDPVELYVRLMALATDTPLHELDPSTDPPSGKALKVANAPLDARQEHRETLLTPPFAEMYQFALLVKGTHVTSVEVEFAPVPQTEDPDDWEVAEQKERRGVPQAQVLRERGYSDDQIDEWTATDDETDLRHRVDLLVQLGTALGGVGGFPAAVEAGIINGKQAAEFTAMLLGLATGVDGAPADGKPEPGVDPAALLSGLPGMPPAPQSPAPVPDKTRAIRGKGGKQSG